MSGGCQHAHGWKALWTGRPRDESPTVDMQIDQPHTTERHNTRDTHATDFQDRASADGKISRICSDKCSADMFPNASCLKKPYENQSHDTYFSQSNLHSNIGLALQICFVLEATTPHGEHPSCAVRTSSHMEKPKMQITPWIYGGWEASLMPTTTWPSAWKSSTRTVNRIPMRMIGRTDRCASCGGTSAGP